MEAQILKNLTWSRGLQKLQFWGVVGWWVWSSLTGAGRLMMKDTIYYILAKIPSLLSVRLESSIQVPLKSWYQNLGFFYIIIGAVDNKLSKLYQYYWLCYQYYMII